MAVGARVFKFRLEGLIATIDRRMPRAQRAVEAVVAREAPALRANAVERRAEFAHCPTVGVATNRVGPT
jgi:hypothetical protein